MQQCKLAPFDKSSCSLIHLNHLHGNFTVTNLYVLHNNVPCKSVHHTDIYGRRTYKKKFEIDIEI